MLPVLEMAVLIHNLQIPKHARRRLWLATAIPVWIGAIALAQTTKVEQVRLLGDREIKLEIVANAQITAQAQVLSAPERLAIDVPNATMGSGLHRLWVHRGVVKDIRVGLFSTNPPITRIVVDWSGPTPYQVVPSGKSVIVKLGDVKLENDHHFAPARRPPLAGNTPEAGSRVERVSLVNNDGVKLEIVANGPITPLTQVVTDPVRLVIDVPNATPGAALHPLVVGHWGVKNVRTGLFSSKPPITRVVVDLDALQPYQVSSSGNAVIVQLGGPDLFPTAREPQVTSLPQVPARPPVPAMPKVAVSYRAGLLGIRAEQATLAEVLNEVHRKTGADIAIPPGAEQDRIVVNLGPAGPNEVLSSLLNGSRFNFIVTGSPGDPSRLRSVLLMPKELGVQLPASDSEKFANGAPHLYIANLTSAGSFQNKNKLGAHLSPPPAAGTTLLPSSQPSSSEQAPPQPSSSQSSTPQPSAPQQPSTLPTDEELSTPRPVGVEPPPGI